MSRTTHHEPYDVQMRVAWGDTEPPVDIDPLTGEAWARGAWKGPRADRFVKGTGTYERPGGFHVGGDNPSAHREFLGRPRTVPSVTEWDDDGALADYEAEQRWLDQESEDLYSAALDDDDDDDDDDYVCPDSSCCFCGTCDCDLDEVG